MAVQFDLFDNPERKGQEGPMFHARVITKDVVTTKNLRDSICKKCTVTPADVAGVLAALGDEICQALSNGYSVHLDELGFFALGLKCAPDVNPKHVASGDISVRTINFTPDKDFAERFKTVEFKRCTTHGHHSDKMDYEDVKAALAVFFEEKRFMVRREFEDITGFNKVKSLRYIRRLMDEGLLRNAGTRFQPVYVMVEK